MSVYNNPKFKSWLRLKIAESLAQESIDDIVDREIQNVKVEVRDDKGRWVEDV